jgi:isoquinoline 1-oxidoreductase beta subunit
VISRRDFVRVGGTAGGGLLLAYSIGGDWALAQTPSGAPAAAAPAAPPGAQAATTLSPAVFVHVDGSGAIRIYSARPDIGQGIKTSSGMIVAEEMDADWAKVTVEQSPVDMTVYGAQSVGGSRSTLTSWDPLRRCGAAARAMMVTAAAQTWNVPEYECTTERSVVTHWPSRRTLGYGELAARAAQVPVPDAGKLALKVKSDYKLVGTRVANVDNAKIVTGQSLFGMDVQMPGMRYAAIARAPRRNASVRGANLDEVKRLPGVFDAFVLEGKLVESGEVVAGVVVIANSTWRAFSARKSLKIDWDESKAAADSSSSYERQARELAKGTGTQVLKQSGDVAAAFTAAKKTVEGFYTYPFLNHAPMEPQNTTAWYRDGAIEMWAPVQTVDRARASMAQLLGIGIDKVTVHLPRIGGGFGRRLTWDYMSEAALIATRVPAPVKLVWSREDDMQHDYFRPGGFHALKAAVDAGGKLSAWQEHFITFSPDGRNVTASGNLDASEFPAPAVSNVHMSQSLLPLATRTGAWRAPRSNGLAFPMQGFLHEISSAAGRDHAEFLLDLFGAPRLLAPGNAGALHTGRAAGVIRLATEKAGWGGKLPREHAHGLAFYYSHSGYIAEVVELSVSREKKITVHRVTVAGDVGLIVNRSGAEQQVQGAVMDALSTTLGLRITLENGAVQQTNFGDYPLMRIASAPRVDVHFVESDMAPTGLGEPALPPLAPAVCNAIFAATGERVRTLPLSASGYTA